ncbi:MAG: iron-containing redox enzyme family protein [Polyangiaceae bacterium]
MNANDFDAVVARYDLNEHPFYRAWRAGTLPVSKLAAYACEYAPFIEAIAAGWSTLGEGDHAAEELDHARLWGRFRDALGATGEPSCPEARALVDVAREAFADPVESLGALYAFECQQPSTTRSKLDGLREHYSVAEEATAYFRIHAGDYGERERLRGLAAALTPGDGERATRACERTCRAMWSALDGVMGGCAS